MYTSSNADTSVDPQFVNAVEPLLLQYKVHSSIELYVELSNWSFFVCCFTHMQCWEYELGRPGFVRSCS